MNTAWFVTLGVMLITYAVLDGFDLGIGSMHLLVARKDNERRAMLSVIGPFWFGYEVWLIASAGAMISAFPNLYADSFSGFYLVLTVVLWMLIARGTAIEFRNRVDDSIWRGFWDVVFCVSSTVLCIFFGAAFANVFQGVPIDSAGEFTGTFTTALNPFAITVGLLAWSILSIHGLSHAVSRLTDSDIKHRALLYAKRLAFLVIPLTIATAIAGVHVRPTAIIHYQQFPILDVIPLIVGYGLVRLAISSHNSNSKGMEISTTVLILGLMSSAGVSLFPYLLPAYGTSTLGLTIYNSAVSSHNLETSLILALFTLVLVAAYAAYEHAVLSRPIVVGEIEQPH